MKKIALTITKPFVDIYNAFFANNEGMSLRKLAFAFALGAAYQLQQSVLDDHVKQNIISSWQIFGAVCIGLVTIPELIKFLNRGKDEPTDGQA
jgi:hypothetical protein